MEITDEAKYNALVEKRKDRRAVSIGFIFEFLKSWLARDSSSFYVKYLNFKHVCHFRVNAFTTSSRDK